MTKHSINVGLFSLCFAGAICNILQPDTSVGRALGYFSAGIMATISLVCLYQALTSAAEDL